MKPVKAPPVEPAIQLRRAGIANRALGEEVLAEQPPLIPEIGPEGKVGVQVPKPLKLPTWQNKEVDIEGSPKTGIGITFRGFQAYKETPGRFYYETMSTKLEDAFGPYTRKVIARFENPLVVRDGQIGAARELGIPEVVERLSAKLNKLPKMSNAEQLKHPGYRAAWAEIDEAIEKAARSQGYDGIVFDWQPGPYEFMDVAGRVEVEALDVSVKSRSGIKATGETYEIESAHAKAARAAQEPTMPPDLPSEWEQFKAEEQATQAAASPLSGTGAGPPQPPESHLPPPVGGRGATPPLEPLPPLGTTTPLRYLKDLEATMLKTGDWVQKIPGIRKAAEILVPTTRAAVRNVYVAYKAMRGVHYAATTEWEAAKAPLTRELYTAFKETTPKFTGPSTVPLAVQRELATAVVYPEMFEPFSPRLNSAIEALQGNMEGVYATARTQLGVDVGHFPYSRIADNGNRGLFLPTVESRASLEEGMKAFSTNTTKTRFYQGFLERMQAVEAQGKKFVPELDVKELLRIHDEGLARSAGQKTFQLGSGGMSKLDAMVEQHPKLAAKMVELRQRLAGLQGTLGRLDAKVDEALANFIDNPDTDLSQLYMDLDVRVGADAVGRQGPNFGKTAPQLRAELKQVRAAIKDLQPAWENADLRPLVKSEITGLYHPLAQAEAMGRIFQSPLKVGQGLLDVWSEVLVTTFGGDISPLTIQGLLGTLAHPLLAIRNTRGIIRSIIDDDFLASIVRDRPGWAEDYAKFAGRPYGVTSPELYLPGKGIERIPYIRAPWKQINTRTMRAVEYLRGEGWDADTRLLQRWGGKTKLEAQSEAWNTWSKVMPALDPAEIGVGAWEQQLRRAPVISTSFIFGPAGLVKDAASGILKLGASREISPVARWQGLLGREQLAVLRMTQMAGSAVTLSTASYIIAGYDPEKAFDMASNPAKGRFCSLAIGKTGYIPFGGPYRSFFRAMAPRHEAGKGIGGWVPFAGFTKWVEAKESPSLNTAIVTLFGKNQDYLGRPVVKGDFPANVLSGLWYAAERHMPLTAGAVSEKVRTDQASPGNWRTLATEAGTQLSGVSYYETSPGEQLTMQRDKAAQDKFGKLWDELEPHEKWELQADQPELTSPKAGVFPETSRTKSYQAFRAIGESTKMSQQVIDTAYEPGQDWRSAYQDVRLQQAGSYRQWETEHPNEAKQMQSMKATDDNYRALSDYSDAFDSAMTPWGTIDAEKLTTILDTLEAGWTARQKQFVEDNTGKYDTSRVKEYKADQKALRPYWEIEDQVWDRLIQSHPEYSKYTSIDDYANAQVADMMRRGLTKEQAALRVQQLPLLSRIGSIVGEIKMQYRLTHPTVDALLLKWEYASTPARSQVSLGGRRRRQRRTMGVT
jgi:hypothetical protein